MLCILPSSVFCVLNLECRGDVLQVTPMHTVLQQTLVAATVTCDSLANMHRIYPYQAGYKACYPVGKVNARVKSRKYRGQSPRLNIMQVIKRARDIGKNDQALLWGWILHKFKMMYCTETSVKSYMLWLLWCIWPCTRARARDDAHWKWHKMAGVYACLVPPGLLNLETSANHSV